MARGLGVIGGRGFTFIRFY